MLPLLFGSGSAQVLAAQNDTTTILLYDSLTGEVIRVGADGTVQTTFTLPAQSAGAYPQNVAVSAQGDTFAYVIYGESPTLNVLRGEQVFVQPLPATTTADSLAFVASSALFTPGGDQFAFAYATGEGNWQVQLLAESAGWAPVAVLDQTASIPGVSQLDALGRSPIVQRLNPDGIITLVLAEPFSGFQTNFATAFAWNPTDGTVTRTDVPTAIDGDVLNESELTLLFDPALPNTADAFTYPQANALYLTEPGAQRRLLFNAANVSLFWSRFVTGGQYVLVGSFSPENRISWLILTPGGDVVGDFPPLQMTGVVGTPGGFVYTVDAGANAGSLLYRVEVTADGAGDPVEVWSGPEGASYRVIWAG